MQAYATPEMGQSPQLRLVNTSSSASAASALAQGPDVVSHLPAQLAELVADRAAAQLAAAQRRVVRHSPSGRIPRDWPRQRPSSGSGGLDPDRAGGGRMQALLPTLGTGRVAVLRLGSDRGITEPASWLIRHPLRGVPASNAGSIAVLPVCWKSGSRTRPAIKGGAPSTAASSLHGRSGMTLPLGVPVARVSRRSRSCGSTAPLTLGSVGRFSTSERRRRSSTAAWSMSTFARGFDERRLDSITDAEGDGDRRLALSLGAQLTSAESSSSLLAGLPGRARSRRR
jgi:hypothetical protein